MTKSVMDQLEPAFTINPCVAVDPAVVGTTQVLLPGRKWIGRPGAINFVTAVARRWQFALALVEGTA